jgi:acetyl-CoA synthetase
MSEILYKVPEGWPARTHANDAKYRDMYARSVRDPEGFWSEHGKRIDWIKPYTWVKRTSFAPGNVSIEWFGDGTTNVSLNCIDRHLAKRADQIAIIWEGDDPNESKSITYRQLHDEVCRFANVLKAHGVKKGDTVTIYLPMIPEAAYAMLACARIGAVHSIVFGGFLAGGAGRPHRGRQFQDRDHGGRGPARRQEGAAEVNADEAANKVPGTVTAMIVVKRTGGQVQMISGRDFWYHEEAAKVTAECKSQEMKAEDPLFILYTSGSTGKPRAYCIPPAAIWSFASMTHQYVFDYHDGDIYWCTADVGWVTGHSYIVYGPLANGATTLMFEGVPTVPLDLALLGYRRQAQGQYLLYSADCHPLADGGGRGAGEEDQPQDAETARFGRRADQSEAWEWYHRVVGDGRCPIVDTWWQTETGGILITPLPGATDLKPGSAGRPFFGLRPEIVDSAGHVLEGACEGNLVIADSWPGQMRTVYGDHKRFEETYFSTYPNKYFTGDGCRRDGDGYYWITGRVDDVINVSGHRMGTAEVESALVAHESVSEAACRWLSTRHQGPGHLRLCDLMAGETPSEVMRKELVAHVRKEIGPIASPDIIQFAPGLPKTRSGKIMRRILRKIAESEFSSLGDTSTLADPSVVDDLIAKRKANS